MSSKILTCNYAQDLEKLDDVPAPESNESVTSYARHLQDWAIGSIAINKRNQVLRKYTADCIQKIIIEE